MGYGYYARQPSEPYPAYEYSTHEECMSWCDNPNNYLRRNLWGGCKLAAAMVELGMAYEVEQYIALPEWPDVSDYDVVWSDDANDYVGQQADAFRQALVDHRSWHGVSDIPGIPVHKIAGSNDGWHVTALECQAALGIYRQKISEGVSHPDVFRDDVIPFLKHGASTDGFETH